MEVPIVARLRRIPAGRRQRALQSPTMTTITDSHRFARCVRGAVARWHGHGHSGHHTTETVHDREELHPAGLDRLTR